MLCVKAGQRDPAWELGSQKPGKELETAPLPTVKSPTKQPKYTTATSM